MPIYRWTGTVWKDVLALVVPPGGGDPYADALAAREALVYGQPSAFPVANTSTGILPTSTCGLLDPSVLTAYNAPSTQTVTLTDGAVFQDKIIYGDVRLPATHNLDIIANNCLFKGGPQIPSSNDAVIKADNNRSGTGKFKAYDCEISPQLPALNRDGIRGNRWEWHRGYIHDTIDGATMYAGPTQNGGGQTYTGLYGSLIERLRYMFPDYDNGVSGPGEHPIDGTHNDLVVLSGGKSQVVRGNLLRGSSVDLPGAGQNPTHPQLQASGYSHGACIIFVDTVGSPPDLSVVVEDNWLWGAVAHYNVKPNMVATVRNNRHYRAIFIDPTPPVSSSGYWIRYDQRAGNGVICASDVWVDGPYVGQILVEPRDRGINFNT